jgi:predicted acyltransferase
MSMWLAFRPLRQRVSDSAGRLSARSLFTPPRNALLGACLGSHSRSDTWVVTHMDWRALGRIAVALVFLIAALIGASLGATWAIAIAGVALVAMFVLGVSARWPWQT